MNTNHEHRPMSGTDALARAWSLFYIHAGAMPGLPRRSPYELVASLLCVDYDLDEHEVLNRLNVDGHNVVADAMQAEGNPHGEWLTAWLLSDAESRGRALRPLRSAMAERVQVEVKRLRAEHRARLAAQLAEFRLDDDDRVRVHSGAPNVPEWGTPVLPEFNAGRLSPTTLAWLVGERAEGTP